jgi:crossover junction endodeoxyribonuclease RuvC
MIILGIDPGTAITGYGVINFSRGKMKVLGLGQINTSKDTKHEYRLKEIYNAINKLLKEYKPDALAVEKIFFFKNAKTIIPVSQSRGVVLLAGAKKNIPLYEFTPLQVKMQITGYGRADKKDVQKKVKEILDLEEIPKPDDIADALGIALTCANFLEIA